MLDKTPSVLVVAEEAVAVVSVSPTTLVVVLVQEMVLMQLEMVLVLEEDKVHIEEVVQELQHHLLALVMQVMVVLQV